MNFKLKPFALGAIAAMSVMLYGVEPGTPGWIAFEVPALDVPAGSVADIGFLNPAPAGQSGRIQVKDAHFVDGNGTPLRLWGTNLAGRSCFIPAEDAQRMAKRLRQWGMNCVRLHMLDDDHPYHKSHLIWEDPAKGKFSEENLRKLDQLIASLKAEGIYIDLNLHCSWRYLDPPDFSSDYPGDYRYGKLLNIWEPNAVKAQKMYNMTLLNRVNTATGIRYADDPAIFCVELNNENSLLKDARDSFFKLPAALQQELNRQWTVFLKNKYSTDAALQSAWGITAGDAAPQKVINWGKLDMDGGASTLTAANDGSCKWVITKPGKNPWSVMMQAGLDTLPAERQLGVTFRVRGTDKAAVKHYIRMQGAPYQVVVPFYYNDKLILSNDWQTIEVKGVIKDPGQARQKLCAVFEFESGKTGEIEIEGYQVTDCGTSSLGNQTLATGMTIPQKSSNQVREQDYQEFLLKTEMNNVTDMYQYVRNEIGYRGLIVNTVAGYFSVGGQYRESMLSDFLDHHDYYQHPRWKDGKLEFDNSPMEADPHGGTLPLITFWRDFRKPFTVSEASTPAPNDHAADFLPMDSIMFSIQDWDAFYSYAYSQWKTNFTNTAINETFHIIGRANVLVHQPFAALLFRQCRMPVAKAKTALEIPTGKLYEYMVQGWHAGELNAIKCKGSNLASYSARQGFVFSDAITEPRLVGGNGQPKYAAAGAVVSDDGSFHLDNKDAAGAYATLNLPGARMLSGNVGGRNFTIGDIQLAIAPRPWPHKAPAYACITLITLDGKPVGQSSRMLLAASGRTEPQNLAWNATRTGLIEAGAKAWGNGPNLSELIPLTLTLPTGCYTWQPLDPQGFPSTVKHVSTDGKITIGDKDQSLWFLIER